MFRSTLFRFSPKVLWNDPKSCMAFYLEAGIADVCFNVEESEGAHVSELMFAGAVRRPTPVSIISTALLVPLSASARHQLHP